MSFGFSASDLTVVIRLAVTAYKNYTKSAREFEELAEDLDSFKTFLEQTQWFLIRNPPDAQLFEGLRKLNNRSEALLRQLDNFCKGYASLASSEHRKWDKLRWSPSDADEFRKCIRDQMGAWNLYISFISCIRNTSISASIQEIATKLSDLSPERNTGARQGSFQLESPTRSKDEDESRWIPIHQSSTDLGVLCKDIQVVENICWQTLGEKQTQSRDIPWEIIAQDCKGDHVNMDPAESSRFTTLAGMGRLEQTPSDTSGDTNESGESKTSFWEILPRDPPLTFNPTKQSRRSKSLASDSLEVSVADTPVPTRPKLSLSLPKITTRLGSSAPSIGQQRSPFERKLTSPTSRST